MVKQNLSSGRVPQQAAPQQIAQQGITTMQTRPTDINIPHSIDKIVPEVELYRRLQEAEKRVDIFTTRKINDLQENINKIPRKKELLRIFIFNTAENQPWQLQPGQQPGEDPSWTLRIEGRLVNKERAEDPTRRKFSSFLTGISIDLFDKNNEQQQQDLSKPPQQSTKENVIEWHEPSEPNAPRVDFDGLDVKRSGGENVKAKITIQPKEFPIKYRVSSELALLLGVTELTQHDAVYSIWQYIQFNNLQAPEKRIINCDENLSKLFGVPRFNFRDLIDMLSKHLSTNKPIELDYEIKVDKASTLGDTVIDVEVPIDDIQEQEVWKNELKKIITEYDDSIKELNSKIVLGIQALHNSHRKYQFYDQLSKDPVNFLKDFTDSHSRLLKILSGDEGYNEESVRRSDFYTDELLSENVDLLLKTNRI